MAGLWRNKKSILSILLSGVIGCVTMLIFAQIVSPLRLTTDTIRLLSMANSAYQGHGFLYQGVKDQFPHGYPTLVQFLQLLGFAHSITLILVNIIALVICLIVLKKLSFAQELNSLPRKIHWMLAILFVICSWCLIKHVTIPLTEFVYLVLSFLSLWAILTAINSETIFKQGLMWILALSLALLSLNFRTIGVALLPTLLFSYLLSQRRSLRVLLVRIKTRSKYLIYYTLIVSLMLIVCTSIFSTISDSEWFYSQFTQENSYLKSQIRVFFQNGIYTTFADILSFRLYEMGELFLNLPASKCSLPNWIFTLTGMLAWGTIFYGARLLWKVNYTVSLYLLFYLLIMISWPYQDTRFWLPVIPLIGLCVLQAIDSFLHTRVGKSIFFRTLLVVWLSCYVSFGFMALSYSSKISFSGEKFGSLYGGGSLSKVYQLADQEVETQKLPEPLRTQVLILRIFD